MLCIKQDPIESAFRDDFRGNVAAQARPQADLKLALAERALERVRLKFDHDVCPLYKLDSKSAERPEIGVQSVALLREYDAGKRAGKHDVSWFERMPLWANFVGEPGDAKCRMTQHPGSQTRFFDLRIPVHDATDPAQVDIHGPNRPTAHCDTGRGAVVRNGIDDLALVLQARIDDLNRGNHVFGRAQYVGQTHAGPHQSFAHDEGQFDLDTRLAVIGMLDPGAVGDQLIIEDIAIVRFIDHRRSLHRF